jgi:hypothetical protein
MDLELMRQWMSLDERKRQLKADLDEVNAQLDEIDDAVTNEFIANGIDKVSIDGRTVYVACDRWPKVLKDKPSLLSAMRTNGLGDFVKEDFNTQSLRGVINEWIRNYLDNVPDEQRGVADVQQAIPEALREVLGVSEVYTVKSRKK